MTQRTKYIFITGPAGGGKTTLAELLTTRLTCLQKTVKHMEIKEPLKLMLYGLAESQLTNNLTLPRTESCYAELKRTVFYGRTGRDWMVRWGEDIRDSNEGALMQHILAVDSQHLDYCIVSDMGFQSEWQCAQRNCADPVAIYQSQYCTNLKNTSLLHGAQFYGDSRECLIDYCSLVNPTVAEVVDALGL